MQSVPVSEMRQIEGGIWWGWVTPYAKSVAIARYYYEHRRMGRHVTNYGFMGLTCPICGRP